MCTKILLAELDKLKWNGSNALEDCRWRLRFRLEPWTKGLAVQLTLTDEAGEHLPWPADKTIVLRRGQEPKLVRTMLRMWAEGRSGSKSAWLDKKIDSDTRIGPNIQQFVNAVMAKYKDGDVVAKERALDDLRRAVRRAQSAGLTEQDLKVAWDEGLFAQMLQA